MSFFLYNNRLKRKAEKKEKKEKRAAGGGGGGEKRERKKKMTKLPGQPKRYQSAYFIWMNASRESIKAEYPNLSVAEFGKKAGELWKEMGEKKKVKLNFVVYNKIHRLESVREIHNISRNKGNKIGCPDLTRTLSI